MIHTILKKYYGPLLLAILAFAFFTRMFQLHIPEEYYFDEVYHAVTAKLVARNDPRAYEWWHPAPEPNTAIEWLHPPLAKYFQAANIRAFGENSFGWRFSSVIFGVLVVLLTAELTLILTKNHSIALLSAALASLDGLLLTMSRIAMNDIHVTFWILLTLLIYQRARQRRSGMYFILSALSAGAALATKWSGLFVVLILIFFESFDFCTTILEVKLNNAQRKWQQLKLPVLRWFTTVLLLIALPALVYLASYWQMFAQGKDLQHFLDLHNQIIAYQTGLDATHPAQSRPWQWFLDLKPVWLYVKYGDQGSRADMYAFGNPLLFWVGAAAVFFALGQLLELKQKRSWLETLQAVRTNPSFFLLVAYIAVWVPWIFSPRIMFFYHYTPAVPLLCCITSLQLARSWKTNPRITSTLLGLILMTFVIWYPHWVGILMPEAFVKYVYFVVPSWK